MSQVCVCVPTVQVMYSDPGARFMPLGVYISLLYSLEYCGIMLALLNAVFETNVELH